MACECCGIEAPTQRVEFQQNIGLFVTRIRTRVDKNLCKGCIGRYFRSYTVTTLCLGWWGLISFVMTRVILFSNVSQYLSTRELPESGINSLNISGSSIGAKPPHVGSGPIALKLLYGVLLAVAILILVAQTHVDFLEKHAPALNAKLHSGEITDDADGEYAGTKIGADLDGLEADLKGTKWADIRSELLARDQYRVDLNEQNGKLQRKLTEERNANLGANDPCEALAINEFGPALDGYTTALNKLFAFAKDAAVINKSNSDMLDQLSDGETSASNQLNQYFKDVKSHGCAK